MRNLVLPLAFAVVAGSLSAALAVPAKPVPASFYSGRWYEIARTPNLNQRDCEAPTYQFAPKTAETLAFIMTCHKGEPDGKPESLNVTLHLPQDEARNRFRVTAYGGLASVNYLVADRAEDGDWWILETTQSHKVWLLARNANVSGADRSDALASLKALGVDVAKLEFPKQG